MRNQVVKKVIIDSINSFTGNDSKSYVVVEIDHDRHIISFASDGADPFAQDFLGLCLMDKDIRKEIDWGMRTRRKNPAKVITRRGQSGSSDLSIVINKNGKLGEYFEKKVASIHLSCFGKINLENVSFWSGDLAVLLYAYGKFIVKGKSAWLIEPTTQERIRVLKSWKYIQPRVSAGVSVNSLQESYIADNPNPKPRRAHNNTGKTIVHHTITFR